MSLRSFVAPSSELLDAMEEIESAYEPVNLRLNCKRPEGLKMEGYLHQYPKSSPHDQVGMEGSVNAYESVDLETNHESREGEKMKDLMSGKKVTKSPLLIVTTICVICIAILFGAVAYLLSSTAKLQEKLMSEEEKRSDGEKILTGFNSSVKDLKTSQNKSATDFEEMYIKFSKSLNDLQSRQAEGNFKENFTTWKNYTESEINQLKADLNRKDNEIRSLKTLTLLRDCEDTRRSIGGDGRVVSLLRGGNIYEVYCDIATDGGNWVVFQRRMDGSVDFYRTWEEYATGFGNKSGEFWLGLETVYQLTQNGNYELRVDLTDWDGSTAYAKYGKFSVSGKSDAYRLTVGEYSGNAGDSLNHHHNGRRFSTKDRDLDSRGDSCAALQHAAWWFGNCAYSSLNGRYNDTTSWASGVYWYYWGNRQPYSLKAAEMKFRKK